MYHDINKRKINLYTAPLFCTDCVLLEKRQPVSPLTNKNKHLRSKYFTMSSFCNLDKLIANLLLSHELDLYNFY